MDTLYKKVLLALVCCFANAYVYAGLISAEEFNALLAYANLHSILF